MVSAVLKTMMNSQFKEARTRIVHLPHVKGEVLEKVCQYFYYVPRFNRRQEIATSAGNSRDTGAIGKSNFNNFSETFDIPPELSIEIYLCARYLEL